MWLVVVRFLYWIGKSASKSISSMIKHRIFNLPPYIFFLSKYKTKNAWIFVKRHNNQSIYFLNFFHYIISEDHVSNKYDNITICSKICIYSKMCEHGYILKCFPLGLKQKMKIKKWKMEGEKLIMVGWRKMNRGRGGGDKKKQMPHFCIFSFSLLTKQIVVKVGWIGGGVGVTRRQTSWQSSLPFFASTLKYHHG